MVNDFVMFNRYFEILKSISKIDKIEGVDISVAFMKNIKKMITDYTKIESLSK